MSKVFLEYIWLDGNNPQNLRSKTKVVDDIEILEREGNSKQGYPESYPLWSFDGSSTKQAGEEFGFEGTDCVLKPVYVVGDPFRSKSSVSTSPHKLVFCEVFNPYGKTPHKTNTRSKLRELLTDLKFKEYDANHSEVPWFGWEQEYVITHAPNKEFSHFKYGGGIPLGFGLGEEGKPRPQGDYYCGVGGLNVIGRELVEEHIIKCAEIGLNIGGINAEVLIGQWEYQIGPVTALNGSDQLWVSRYILERVAEKKGLGISYHPKPVNGDWNGSGCHVNFSTKEMRDKGGLKKILEACNKLSERHTEHIEVYGEFNDKRLTGKHETSSMETFSLGNSDRGSSIRIPVHTYTNERGYFEDRRPAANCDPYKVSNVMIETVFDKAGITVEQ
jgi:glutamine synthetase